MRARVLLPLTVAVLAAHGWLLWQLPAWSGVPAASDMAQAHAPAFMTRSIAPPPAPPPPAPAAAASRPQAKPRPPVSPTPVPTVPAVEDAGALEPPSEEAQPAAQVESAAAPQPPEEPASSSLADAAAADAAAVETAAVETAAADVASVDTAAAPAEAEVPTLQGVQLTLPGGKSSPPDAALPVQLPPPARLSFEVSGQAKSFDYRASAELLWQHDGHSYQARQQIKAFLVGTRAQASQGQVTAAGLVPQRFTDQGRREKSAELDFSAHEARFTPAAAPAPIGEGAQDRLSVFFQLSALLAAAPERYPAGSEITFTTVGSNDAERWTFRVQGLQTLQLPLGALPALHLERLPRYAGDQQAALWLAPSLGYLPARIRLTQANGDFADLRLQAHAPP